MPINWFTVIAQAINFLILVWLLKRFLYKPVLRAIEEREQGIAAQLAQAEAKKAESQKERDDFQHKNDVFDQERAALLKKAADEVNSKRQGLLDQARKDADLLRAKRQEALLSEQRNLSAEIMRSTQKEVFAITRRTLMDLASESLEQRMSTAFVARLRGLTGAAKEQLATALKASPHPACVRSAFDLPPAQRSEIENAVKQTFPKATAIQFETAPKVVCGVELSVGGVQVAWSIADYLTTLEKSAGELLHEDAKLESQSDAKAEPEAKAPSQTDSLLKSNNESKVVPKLAPKSRPQPLLEPVPATAKADH